jgi:hypothetical protein
MATNIEVPAIPSTAAATGVDNLQETFRRILQESREASREASVGGVAPTPAAKPTTGRRINWFRLTILGIIVVLIVFVACVCIRRMYEQRWNRTQLAELPSWAGTHTEDDFAHLVGRVGTRTDRRTDRGVAGPKWRRPRRHEDEDDEARCDDMQDEDTQDTAYGDAPTTGEADVDDDHSELEDVSEDDPNFTPIN